MLDSHRRLKSYRNIISLLLDFNVKNENELVDKLAKEALTIPCLSCKKEISIEQINIMNDDPYCNQCFYEDDYNDYQ